MALIFAFGFCFELPVLLTLLARVGIVTSAGLASKRRYAIVGVVAIAAVVTPPDVLSQISLAIPLIGLYEISIVLAKLMERKRAQQDAERDREFDEEAETAPPSVVQRQ
jgi:sec-independent protein translocase protein TatC